MNGADVVPLPYADPDQVAAVRGGLASEVGVATAAGRDQLNKELPSDGPTNNRYTRAGQTIRDWQQAGVIVQDSGRSLYVYHQDFEVEGRRLTRKGFMARVRLEKFGSGKIFPHEETLSGPKADRLKLFHATHMNLSQIWLEGQ